MKSLKTLSVLLLISSISITNSFANQIRFKRTPGNNEKGSPQTPKVEELRNPVPKDSGYVSVGDVDKAEQQQTKADYTSKAETGKAFDNIKPVGESIQKSGEHLGNTESFKPEEFYPKAGEGFEKIKSESKAKVEDVSKKASNGFENLKSQGESLQKAGEQLQNPESLQPEEFYTKAGEGFEKIKSESNAKVEDISGKVSNGFENLKSQANSEKASTGLKNFRTEAEESFSNPTEVFEKAQSHGQALHGKSGEIFNEAKKLQRPEISEGLKGLKSSSGEAGEMFRKFKSQGFPLDKTSSKEQSSRYPQHQVPDWSHYDFYRPSSFSPSHFHPSHPVSTSGFFPDSFRDFKDSGSSSSLYKHAYHHPVIVHSRSVTTEFENGSPVSVSHVSTIPTSEYDTYETEFDKLTAGEGEFDTDVSISSIALKIMKILGDLKKAVTPVLKTLVEDESGNKVFEICKIARARKVAETASEALSSQFSQFVKLESRHGDLKESRLKSYRAFRSLQEVTKELNQDFLLIKDPTLNSIMETMNELTSEAITAITQKKKPIEEKKTTLEVPPTPTY